MTARNHRRETTPRREPAVVPVKVPAPQPARPTPRPAPAKPKPVKQ